MKVSVQGDADAQVVLLDGALDELVHAALQALRPKLRAKLVVFDCSRIAAVNSVGIRRWTVFLDELGPKRPIAYRNCPPALVEYFQLLPSKMRAEAVQSLAVPYRCGGCERAEEPIFETAELRRGEALAVLSCKQCGGDLRPAVLDGDYLSFLGERP